MKLVTKNLRLQFNADGSKLIDKQTSNTGDRWWDVENCKLYVDTKKIGSNIEEITNKKMINNFKKLVEITLNEINYVIDVNNKWLDIKNTWRIPINDGFIIKEPLPESEIQSVKNLIEKQNVIKKQYENSYKKIKNTIKNV